MPMAAGGKPETRGRDIFAELLTVTDIRTHIHTDRQTDGRIPWRFRETLLSRAAQCLSFYLHAGALWTGIRFLHSFVAASQSVFSRSTVPSSCNKWHLFGIPACAVANTFESLTVPYRTEVLMLVDVKRLCTLLIGAIVKLLLKKIKNCWNWKL